jgi:hypothetical protein
MLKLQRVWQWLLALIFACPPRVVVRPVATPPASPRQCLPGIGISPISALRRERVNPPSKSAFGVLLSFRAAPTVKSAITRKSP